MGNRANEIQKWIDNRLMDNQKPYKIMFEISVPKNNLQENKYENPIYKKIIELLNKYSINFGFVDTVEGSFNLNRDWLETDDVECFVEYCGIYPIHWNIEDVVEFERMENDGEIIVLAFWHEDEKYTPNH